MTLYQKLREISAGQDHDREFARFILNDPDTVLNGYIREVAAKMYTTPASVTRFCKRLGYPGFRQFKIALATQKADFESNEPVDVNYPVGTNQNIREAVRALYVLEEESLKTAYENLPLREISLAVDLIYHADYISLWGVGDSLNAMRNFQWQLRQSGYIVLSDGELGFRGVPQRNHNQNEVAVITSIFGESTLSEELIRKVRSSVPHLIIVTANPKCRFQQYADCFIAIPSDEDTFHKMSHYSTYTALHFVFDVMHAILYQKGQQKEENIRKYHTSH